MRDRPFDSYSGLFVVLVVVAALAVTAGGCGPTPQERYATALEIFHRESDALAALKPGCDAAVSRASDSVVKELAGTTMRELVAQSNRELTELRSTPENPTMDQVRESSKRTSAQMKAHAEAVKRIKAAMDRVSEPGTPEYDKYQNLLEADPDYVAYQRQAARVDRAAKETNAAEAALKGDN